MKKWLPVAALFASSLALAQQHPIDQQLQQCLNRESSTAGMSQCYSTATQAWDKEMNAQYTGLMKTLTGEPKDKLRQAQRAWLTYRDSWRDASVSYFSRTQGSVAALNIGAGQVSLVRNQALMLQSLRKGGCTNPDDC